METVLLTGSTGFLGSHLLAGLLKDNYNVVILKRSFSNTWRITNLLSKIKAYDIDSVSLETAFKENKIDAVIHTATTYGKKESDYSSIIESNLLLPVKLLDLSSHYQTESFFNADSFFNTSDLNYKYLSHYSLSKQQLVEWLKILSKKVQIVNLKLEHLYGPKDGDNKFVVWLIRECIKSGAVIKLTKGEQKRDFIYVSDAVNAFLLALKKRKQLSKYSEFEVGTGEATSIKTFALNVKQTVCDVLNIDKSTFLDFGAIPDIEGELMESKADNAGLIQLGWNNSVNLKNGLEKTIKDILEKTE